MRFFKNQIGQKKFVVPKLKCIFHRNILYWTDKLSELENYHSLLYFLFDHKNY